MPADHSDFSYKAIKENNEKLSDFLINNFNKNILTLKKYFPDIAHKFENYIPQKSIDFFCSVNGVPDLIFTGDQFEFYRKKSNIKYADFLSELKKKKETVTDKDFCPKEFSCNFVERIFEQPVTYVYNKIEKDDLGQLHFKYANKISELLFYVKQNGIRNVSEANTLTLFVSVGIGLGYHIEEISAQKEVLNTILIEPDNDVFFASLHCFKWSEYIEKAFNEGKSIVILLEDSPEIIGRNFFMELIKKGIYQMSGGYFCSIYDDKLSNDILKSLDKYYYYLPAAFGFFDDLIFGISHTCYAIANKRNFVLTNPLKNEYINTPIFVIGSGPSLDNDLNFIRKNQDKAIIIACGSALDALYHAGVMPDFYANTERTIEVKQTLDIIPDKDYLEQITLLCSSVCHPYVVNNFPKTAIFWKWDENFSDYLVANLDKSCRLKNIQTINHMNPLVGNMGITSAITLGFNKIFLFGIDNGKKQGTTSIHSNYTSLFKNNKFIENRDSYRTSTMVQGNFGGICETNTLYLKSINNIEVALEEKMNTPDFSCINCSDGALIRHTKPVHSSELQDKFNKYPLLDKQRFFKDFFEEKTSTLDISREDLKKVIHPEIFNRINDNIIEIIKQYKQLESDKLRVCVDINYFLTGIKEKISTFFSRLSESSLNSMLALYTTALYCKDEIKGKKIADEILDVIVDFLTEEKEIYAKLPDYTLGEHRKYFPNGKVGKDMPHCKAPDFPPLMNIIEQKNNESFKKFVKRYE